MFAKAVFTLGAGVQYSLRTNVSTQFFQISIPVLKYKVGTNVLSYKSGQQVPVCTLFLLVLGQFTPY